MDGNNEVWVELAESFSEVVEHHSAVSLRRWEMISMREGWASAVERRAKGLGTAQAYPHDSLVDDAGLCELEVQPPEPAVLHEEGIPAASGARVSMLALE